MEEIIDYEKSAELFEKQINEFDKNVYDLRVKSRELFEREYEIEYNEFKTLNWLKGLNAKLSYWLDCKYHLVICNKVDFLIMADLKMEYYLSYLKKFGWIVGESKNLNNQLTLRYLTCGACWVFETSDASLLTQFIKDNNISVGCSYNVKINLENRIDDILNLYRSCFDVAPKINIKCVDSITL